MRRLIIVPVVHTAADLGSLAEAVRARYMRDLGPDAWNQRERVVESLWDAIRKNIVTLRVDWRTVLVYQDGLPVCGHEQAIVKELAGAGSRNHQLVLELIERGATLIGTEDPQLLIREYQFQRRHMQPSDAGASKAAPSPVEAAELLELRDRFIAGRIAETLRAGQTGLLFLGAAHRLDALLARDIEIAHL